MGGFLCKFYRILAYNEIDKKLLKILYKYS